MYSILMKHQSAGKTLLSALFLMGMVLVLLSPEAHAAGVMRFDFENNGTLLEQQYELEKDEWINTGTKNYEYYPDGTLKAVRFEAVDFSSFSYEGHYDPLGHLMDPNWTYYTRYTEGIIIDTDYEPVRVYDNNGRITRFEAVNIGFDTAKPYQIVAVYEYDDQNRVSRVTYQYSDEVSTAGDLWQFRYSENGGYTTSSEHYENNESVMRCSYSYDAEGHLIRYESSSDMLLYDGQRFVSGELYIYGYDENGYLINEAFYEDNKVSPEYRNIFRYQQKNGDTIVCEIEEEIEGTQETASYTLDGNNRIIEEKTYFDRKYIYKP